MDIRQAILKAADWIEGHPSEFLFSSSSRPSHPGCGTPGCALGWIGTFLYADAELKPWPSFGSCLPDLGFKDSLDFYCLLSEAENGVKRNPTAVDGPTHWTYGASWVYKAEGCARALRLYADKYHPIITPDWEAMAKPGAVPVQRVTET